MKRFVYCTCLLFAFLGYLLKPDLLRAAAKLDIETAIPR